MRQLILFLALSAAVLSAEESKGKSRWRAILLRASAVAVTAATTADIGSSWGGAEMTPYLRSPDGRFGTRGASLKAGILVGTLLTEYWLVKKRPSSVGAITVFNAASAAVSTRIALRNLRIQRRSPN